MRMIRFLVSKEGAGWLKARMAGSGLEEVAFVIACVVIFLPLALAALGFDLCDPWCWLSRVTEPRGPKGVW